MSYVHDLSVEGGGSAGNVFSAGRADDMAFDHHKKAPHGNVFTDIDAGAGNRIWRCGGGANLGRQSGGWETFWNIRAAKALGYPPAGWGPWSMNLVGFTTASGVDQGAVGRLVRGHRPGEAGAGEPARRAARPPAGPLVAASGASSSAPMIYRESAASRGGRRSEKATTPSGRPRSHQP